MMRLRAGKRHGSGGAPSGASDRRTPAVATSSHSCSCRARVAEHRGRSRPHRSEVRPCAASAALWAPRRSRARVPDTTLSTPRPAPTELTSHCPAGLGAPAGADDAHQRPTKRIEQPRLNNTGRRLMIKRPAAQNLRPTPTDARGRWRRHTPRPHVGHGVVADLEDTPGPAPPPVLPVPGAPSGPCSPRGAKRARRRTRAWPPRPRTPPRGGHRHGTAGAPVTTPPAGPAVPPAAPARRGRRAPRRARGPVHQDGPDGCEPPPHSVQPRAVDPPVRSLRAPTPAAQADAGAS